ncbi:N,N-dimethylformamidase beta subunit family domain-containing protein [Kribbella jejuensis]|uniref:N,N-dimethylformamidase beta subunit family domain-containing protein n=1 Tax=Kribbella jejuensis TaxID=236068 RepID=UPI00114FD228|nr:N,N-dimethylformamidase beta subunit family domain-containing protein [Kribbella jejuensis]
MARTVASTWVRRVALVTAGLLASATLTVIQPAAAIVAGVAISAATASNGTTTLSYRATATRAGTLRYIVVSVPAGSGGRITSVNGSVRTVSPGVLLWRPIRTTSIVVGARFSIPFYGVRLPSGSPWTLSFRATSTTGNVLSAGTGTLVRPADVRITATRPIPGSTTALTYAGTVGRPGVLGSVRMKLPTGARGTLTSVNGTLSAASGYATWRPRAPITVRGGTRLAIPVYGVVLSKYGGIMQLGMTATASTGTQLMGGTGTLALIAPPAPMPTVLAGSFPTIPAGCPSSWPATTAENAKPGTGAWVIPASMNGPLAAYLTKVSATCGTTVGLKVTSGRPVSVVAYRMGYYQGLGAREIWRRNGVPTVVQPAPTIGGAANGHPLRMASAANWSTTLTIAVDRNWVPGTYLIKVSDGRYAAYAPLTVRDDTGHKHALLIQQGTTTWEAYNWYGGRSFYSSPTTGSGRLTFDRPYAEGQGSGEFLPLEQGLIAWAESRGLDVTYWTDNDLDQYGGQLAARAATIFLPGHDEYYSLRMRASLSQAIKRGVNVASFGANATYRRITFTDSTRRAWDIDRYTAGLNSTLWRYLGDAYASQPLLGAEYGCGVLAGNLRTGSNWLFQGVPAGTVVPGFLAGEVDYVWPGLYKQPGLSIVAAGTATCRTSGRSTAMHATAFVAPSGARVFNGSTFAYGCFLVRRCPSNLGIPAESVASRQVVTTMVANIANWVGRGILTASAATTAELRVAVPRQSLAVGDK